MALLYRAIWADDRRELMDVARGAFRSWVLSKRLGVEVPTEGLSGNDGAEVRVIEASDGGVTALRMRLDEERAVKGGAERWTTTLHGMTDSGAGWLWVDLEWVSDDPFARPPDVAAPRVVTALLESGTEHRGPRPSRVASTDVEGLIRWIYQSDRDVPVIVFSVDTSISPQAYSDRVRETARRLAGCADVRMLTVESEHLFDSHMRRASMSVFRGAARAYLPGIDESDPLPWRHRWVNASLLTDRPQVAAGRLVRHVLPRMVAQRPPAIFRTTVKSLLDDAVGGGTDWEALAVELDDEVSDLKARNEQLEEDRQLALLEALDSEREAADARRRLERLRSELRTMGRAPEALEADAANRSEPGSCAEAISAGRDLLHICIHPEAPRDVDRMDASPDSELWGQRIWRHLQALDAYAEAKGPGFFSWCEASGHERSISTKFVSMTESEFVRNNERFRASRLFPVDERIDAEGRTHMWAHLKPVQGGGLQIPRIYFHDDVRGPTGLVHIGFIGPHDLVPNKQSN